MNEKGKIMRHAPITITISRDPFARADFVRLTIKTDDKCYWCGNNRHRHLFRYGWHQDGMNTKPHLSKFAYCSKSCFDCFAS